MKHFSRLFVIVILVLASCHSINAQKGFRIEANIGPALGESRDYHTFALQGNLYYLFQVTDNIDLGITSGFLLYLGDNTDDTAPLFSSIPDGYIPIALAGRIDLSKAVSVGLDTGLSVNIDEDTGFYFRPLLMYHIKEKLSLVASYIHINEKGGGDFIIENKYTAAALMIGLNFGF
ncbi:outer membrane beta-barrel protein [Snuella lapsa]|uniref:Outer membrane protein beta-barrel domain-containing protein n=1 Tax=Snuella lapsa TaxID=870481 RepID=A0ABP6YAC4_9FLAO